MVYIFWFDHFGNCDEVGFLTESDCDNFINNNPDLKFSDKHFKPLLIEDDEQ